MSILPHAKWVWILIKLSEHSPRREKSAPPPPTKNREINAPCSVSEGTWGELLAMTQCEGVFEILETCCLKPTQHRVAQSSSVRFHPRDILLIEKGCWSCGREETGTPCAPWERPQDTGYRGQEPGLPGRCLWGLSLGQALPFSLDNAVCLLHLPPYLGGAAGSGYVLLLDSNLWASHCKKERERKGKKLDQTFQKTNPVKLPGKKMK